MTLGGLGAAVLVGFGLLVAPHWREYRFYNWQMSVTRKPSYTAKAFLDRLSWFPIVHDFFTRMWLVTVAAGCGVLGMIGRARRLHPGERLLLWWVAAATAELLVHDVGNERRLVALIPALVGIAALVLARDRQLLPPDAARRSTPRALLAAPLVLYVFYVLAGPLCRLVSLYEVRPGARLAAAVAALAALGLYLTWPRLPRWLARDRWSPTAALLVALLVVAGDLAQFAQWASARTYKNYEAMVAIGRWLPPGTLVHGKLANGLDLENRIRPVFVGRGFGNYEDRTSRDDIRYLLTYVQPSIGYEGPVIKEVLDAYPGWRVVHLFDVSETAGGRDRAALIDKMPLGRRQEN